MADHSVTMERPRALTDAAARARLGRVYALLVDVARRVQEAETGNGDKPGQEASSQEMTDER